MDRLDFALTAAQRADARHALRLLDGSGISLAEAARRAVEGKRAIKKAKVAECVDAFILDRLRGGLRQRSVDWYEEKLGGFVREFGVQEMDHVTRAELRVWLEDSIGSENTKAAKARAVRAFWRWAMGQEPPYAGTDITAGLRTSGRRRVSEAGIDFLPVADCEVVMRGAGPYRSAMALMLFAGIRPGEIAGKDKPALLWRHVRLDEKVIRIPADVAKNGRDSGPRVIEGLPATVWAWLEPGEADARVCPARAQQAVELAQRLAGFGAKKPWPDDALRHSFATYHVAMYRNPGLTALLLGHQGSVTTLYRHYRGVDTTRDEAKKFWGLRP